MSVEELMSYLGALDIKIWLDGERLRVSAPDQTLTPDLKTQLAEKKPEIVAFLNQLKRPLEATQQTIEKVKRDGPFELSFAQQRLWSLIELQAKGNVYNIPFAFHLRGELNILALKRSLHSIQQRHETLRTRFLTTDSIPYPDILDELDIPLSIVDLQELSEKQTKIQENTLLANSLQQPFDLSIAPLWRAQLLQLKSDEAILSFTMHHLIFDGGSKNIFVDELTRFYNTDSKDSTPDMPQLQVQYVDFANWHRQWIKSKALEQQKSYWKKQLAGDLIELMLPSDHARPDNQTYKGVNQHFHIDQELLSSLQHLTREENGSLFITLMTAFNLLLQRYTGQKDQLVCLPVACRNRSELEPLIGYFNNIVVIRTKLSGDPTIRESIRRVRPVALSAYENEDFPFQQLAELPNLVRTPMTRGMFSYRNTTDQSLTLNGIESHPITIEEQAADFDLAMYIRNNNGSVEGLVRYNENLFTSSSINLLSLNYQAILRVMVSEPDKKLSALPYFGLKHSDVESLLTRHPQIQEAVISWIQDRHSTQQLAAYIVPNQHDIPDLDDIRSYLEQQLPDHLVPFTYTPMDALPLTDMGEVNHQALPEPDPARKTPYKSPKTELEKTLVTIWTKVLWLDHDIGVEDNFFDLGGHSLLSVQLVQEMEKLLGKKLPVEALLRLSTIRDLVTILEKGQVSPNGQEQQREEVDPATISLLNKSGLSQEVYYGLLAHTSGWHGKRVRPKSLIIGLNTESSDQPLFWCFQGFNELTQIAKYLGPNQPVYGMRSGHLVMKKGQENVDILATYYAREILTVQPEGPFLIGGNCQSAQIAFQMASRLREWGHKITLLCLQEQFVAQPYQGRVALFYGDDSTNNPHHYYQNPEEGWKKFYTGKFSINTIAGKHAEFFREPNIQVLAKKLTCEIKLAKAEPDTNLPAYQNTPTIKTNLQAKLGTSNFIWAVPGEKITLLVKVKNIGGNSWPIDKKHSLSLGCCYYTKKGQNVLLVDTGTLLTTRLEPGQSCKLPLQLSMPSKEGRFRVELDILDHNDTWFKYKGSSPVIIKIRVFNHFLILKWLRTIKHLLLQKLFSIR
jgi:acyl carrier protein